jgi:hypothetical protein
MHHHNQTIADLERMEEPSALEVSVYLIALVASLAAIILFLFSF